MIFTTIGSFFTVQTANAKFIVGEEDFYLKVGASTNEAMLTASRDNWAVTGRTGLFGVVDGSPIRAERKTTRPRGVFKAPLHALNSG